MTFGIFLVAFGVAGAFLILGAMIRTLWISDHVRGVGIWLMALLFMGGVGAVVTAYSPVVEPLWLHYVLIVLTPAIIGFVGLSVLIGRGSANGQD